MIAEHTQTATEAPVVLQCVDLCKCYNGVVQASDHINFTLRRGEVHAFLGENGAGKSSTASSSPMRVRCSFPASQWC